MKHGSCKNCFLAVIITAITLGFAAGPAQAYVMQITSQSYSCQAEVWQWSTIYGPPPDYLHMGWELTGHVYKAGEFAASASRPSYAGNTFANAYIEKIHSAGNPLKTFLSFGADGRAVSSMLGENSAHSTAKGTVEFIISKQAGDVNDTVYIPSQFFWASPGSGNPNDSIMLTLNGQDRFFTEDPADYVDIAFQVGVTNTLSFLYEGFIPRYDWKMSESFGVDFTVSFLGIQAVPLPGTLPLLLSGLSLVFWGRRLRIAKRQ